MLNSAKCGYGAIPIELKTDRSIEAEVFSSINIALEKNRLNFPNLTEVLQKNRRFWTHLAVAVGSEGNGLPAELRSKILYLFEVVIHRTNQILRGEADVDLIIDINSSVAAGLFSEGGF